VELTNLKLVLMALVINMKLFITNVVNVNVSENLRTNKVLDEKDLANTGGITTRLDVTPERQSSFKAIRASLQDVAKARAADLVKTFEAAREAGANGRLIARAWR
jgi:hypothetical protein